jgi:hypothetical protein
MKITEVVHLDQFCSRTKSGDRAESEGVDESSE